MKEELTTIVQESFHIVVKAVANTEYQISCCDIRALLLLRYLDCVERR